jgi:aryl-alcohol dehydrogenase-like predicted oxidoreductase
MMLGRALGDFARRDQVVMATKVRGKMHDGPNGEGLSRKAILSELDKSLKRLSQAEVAYLEEPYVPHRIVGHQ